MILYEYPFNERIRSVMRLEYLFKRLFAFAGASDPMQQHVALSVLFEIMDSCDRAEVRTGILQDIDKQKTNLEAYRNYPDVDTEALNQAIADLDRVSAALSGTGRIGQSTRENEWLMSLKNRFAIPGGTSQMDMPSYSAWQLFPEEERKASLLNWIRPFMPLYDGVAQVLKTLRESGHPVEANTQEGGVYQEMLGGKIYQLIRVWVPEHIRTYPEISANKYIIWIRFHQFSPEQKTELVTSPIAFKIALCNV